MAKESWPAALEAALSILRAPLERVLPRVSDVLDGIVPHDGLVLLTGDCVLMSPLRTHGLDDVTATERGRLAGLVGIDRPWFGELPLGGVQRKVLVVTSPAAEPAGESPRGLLAIVLSGPDEPPPTAQVTVQHLVDLAISRISDQVSGVEPVQSAPPGTAMADLTDAYAATLTGLLGVLRAGRLDDSAARRAAIDLAVPALIEIRTGGERDTREQSAGEAFAILADKLALLTRHDDITLDLAAPAEPGRRLPGEVAAAARAIVRGAVLALLDEGGHTRIRVAWETADEDLCVTVRDDGPGTIPSDSPAVHRLRERASGLGGAVVLDAVPGWGTTITVSLPLVAPATRPGGTLEVLNPREHDVLEQLVHGHRNRVIAGNLNISEHTVKFHVANILAKLGVASRGEAAALARDRLPTASLPRRRPA
ncbi:LuxR C-terminal-related transcriptional regulator [Streptomyces sp. B8F3]|uniref:helix-turn-helix transcriptional regulator n=1 Tax=unclassified Streptomyces TaxID=2593676 RepID=UPI00325DA88B